MVNFQALRRPWKRPTNSIDKSDLLVAAWKLPAGAAALDSPSATSRLPAWHRFIIKLPLRGFLLSSV
jgi:hypothetical protein